MSLKLKPAKHGRVVTLPNPLDVLLALSETEKVRRGLQDTPREIFQQPETWLETIDRLAQLRHDLSEFIADFLLDGSGSRPVVILVGAGTSDYIGRTISRMLRHQWGCDVSAVPSTELLTNLDDYILPGHRYLFISFSRSGESSEGVAVLSQALAHYPSQICHLVVTCNENSTMAKMPGVRAVALGSRTNDRGLAMTSSFSNMVLAGQLLAFIRKPHRFEPHAGRLAEIAANKMGEMAEVTADLAAKKFSRVCFLGTGASQAIAEESSLKVLELNAGRIATIAQSALGLRHGPLSFVDDRTLVVAYLSNKTQRQQYELDLLDELQQKQLGAEMLVVAPSRSARIEHLKARLLVLDAPEGMPDDCLPIVDIIVGQLLGLFFSIENGITPDSPSTGAISRVVSHVKIYTPDGGAQ
jgi:D-galactosamine 6-phosphate deaminase/isomerase